MIGLLVVFGGSVVVIFGVTPLRHWFDTRQPASRLAAGGSGSGAPTGLQFLWAGAVLSVAAAVVAVILTATSPGHREARPTSPTGRSAPARLASPGPAVNPPPGAGPGGSPPARSSGPAPAPGTGAPSVVAVEAPADSISPILADISPASGWPGQTVAISGARLFSRSGVITLKFGSYQAPVLCPSQTACQATVPGSMSSAGSGPVTVTVTTDTGTSNPIPFLYRQ